MLKLKVDEVSRQVESLLRENPELETDEILRADMIDGETDAIAIMRELERNRAVSEALANALATTIEQNEKRMARFRKQEKLIRTMMFRLLQAGHLRKLVLPEATLSIASAPARVVITNEAELPDDYFRIKREPDKERIKLALITAAVVPGAELSNSPDYLRISVG